MVVVVVYWRCGVWLEDGDDVGLGSGGSVLTNRVVELLYSSVWCVMNNGLVHDRESLSN